MHIRTEIYKRITVAMFHVQSLSLSVNDVLLSQYYVLPLIFEVESVYICHIKYFVKQSVLRAGVLEKAYILVSKRLKSKLILKCFRELSS